MRRGAPRSRFSPRVNWGLGVWSSRCCTGMQSWCPGVRHWTIGRAFFGTVMLPCSDLLRPLPSRGGSPWLRADQRLLLSLDLLYPAQRKKQANESVSVRPHQYTKKRGAARQEPPSELGPLHRPGGLWGRLGVDAKVLSDWCVGVRRLCRSFAFLVE